MKIMRLSLTIALAVTLVYCVACQFSATTAHISGIKLGKDKNVSPETTSFGANDTFYANAEIANNPGKVKVKAQLAVEDVEGEKPGPIPGIETSLDMDGSGTAIFNFSPPTAGWPKGKYRIDVVMLDENGTQKDQKAASLTVS